MNLYHSLREIEKVAKAKVRWLDLRSLCASYLHAVRGAVGQRVELGRIDYFSALASHLTARNPNVVDEQTAYLAALGNSGVNVTLSRFKQKDVICPKCGNRFVRFEEKETDVAIGMKVMETAARGECEVVVLISGDTDLVPAIKAAKRLSPSLMIGVAFPFMRHNAELRAVADFTFAIGQRDVQRAQFPPAVSLSDGGTVLKPTGW
ncbi:MAG TPA: NYN domain-containing protein [Longimicrobium sp.]|nr:NYN domain-containing protein [Longimicrobium sp.]